MYFFCCVLESNHLKATVLQHFDYGKIKKNSDFENYFSEGLCCDRAMVTLPHRDGMVFLK